MKITSENIAEANKVVYASIDSDVPDEEKDRRCKEAFGFSTTELMDLGEATLLPFCMRRAKSILQTYRKNEGDPLNMVVEMTSEVALAFTMGFLHAVAIQEEQKRAGVA